MDGGERVFAVAPAAGRRDVAGPVAALHRAALAALHGAVQSALLENHLHEAGGERPLQVLPRGHDAAGACVCSVCVCVFSRTNVCLFVCVQQQSPLVC